MPLQEACDYAGIPLVDGKPTLKPADDAKGAMTVLQPWQPSAIGWLMRQLDTPPHGGILADSCGLGKTLTALALVYYSILRQIQRNKDAAEPKPYQASLFVVPA